MAPVADIRVSTGWSSHFKRRRLNAELGPAGVLALLDLWLFAAQNHPADGRLTGMSIEEVESAAAWDGPKGKFVETCLKCRLLDTLGDGLAIHDWTAHQGWLVGSQARSEHARAAANGAWKKFRSERAPGMLGACSEHAVGKPLSSPIPSLPTPTQPQRRDEQRPAGTATPGKGGAGKSLRDQKRLRVRENSLTMQRIGRWFKRQPSTPWMVSEAAALDRLQLSPEQLDAVEAYYLARIPPADDFRRRDLQTLLNNWSVEEDRARGWAARTGTRSPTQTFDQDERKQRRSDAEAKAAKELEEACAEAEHRLNGSRAAFEAWLRETVPLAADQFARSGHVTPTVLPYVAQWEART